MLTPSHAKDMEGLKVLVTAGPTQEALDPVRCLTNHSTGRIVTPWPGRRRPRRR